MSEGEITSPEAIPLKTRPTLLYHGSDLPGASKFIAEHGLLANKNTLTPALEVALVYTQGNGILTFWYPKKSEYENMPFRIITKPRLPLPNIEREKIRQKVMKSALNEDSKERYLNIIDEARTLLPNSSLGGVVSLNLEIQEDLMDSFAYGPDFLQRYTSDKESMIASVEQAITKAPEVIFLDPNLNPRRLAEDMIRTRFEHYLLDIGREIRSYKKIKREGYPVQKSTIQRLMENLSKLKSVTFQEPLYDRYRSMLVGGLERLLREEP